MDKQTFLGQMLAKEKVIRSIAKLCRNKQEELRFDEETIGLDEAWINSLSDFANKELLQCLETLDDENLLLLRTILDYAETDTINNDLFNAYQHYKKVLKTERNLFIEYIIINERTIPSKVSCVYYSIKHENA